MSERLLLDTEVNVKWSYLGQQRTISRSIKVVIDRMVLRLTRPVVDQRRRRTTAARATLALEDLVVESSSNGQPLRVVNNQKLGDLES